MRKLPIFLLAGGLMALLSGCLVVVSGPSISNLSYATSWVTTVDINPPGGQAIPSGTNVICDNKDTTIQYQFKYNNVSPSEISWQEIWTGQRQNGPTTPRNAVNGSGVVVDTAARTVTVSVTFVANTSPFSVSAVQQVGSQAITITPVPFPPTSQRGRAQLTLQFTGGLGTFDSTVIPVMGGC